MGLKTEKRGGGTLKVHGWFAVPSPHVFTLVCRLFRNFLSQKVGGVRVCLKLMAGRLETLAGDAERWRLWRNH